MANTVNKIPSINLPLTNEQGVIHPIWYEFLRSFISSVGDTGGGSGSDNTVIAGAGIVGNSSVSTVNVGQGEGIIVGANSVGVDIIHQTNAQAAPEDEILIADASIGGTIRKTSLRDVANLSPGTFPGGDTSNVQYNNNGIFAGDANFTYNGAGAYTLKGALTVDGTTFTTTASTDKFVFQIPGGTATDHYTFRQVPSTGSSNMPVRFGSSLSSTIVIIDNDLDNAGGTLPESRLVFSGAGTGRWVMGLDGQSSGRNYVFAQGTGLNTNKVYQIDEANRNFAFITSCLRSTAAGLTASTTQTQGQGALTADINEVATVANANDVSTLPTAIAGIHCLVINNGANTLQVFPASGDNLGAGVDTSTTITTGSRKWFVAYDATNWEPVL